MIAPGILIHASAMRTLRPPTNDERRALWAWRFYQAGMHRGMDCPPPTILPNHERTQPHELPTR